MSATITLTEVVHTMTLKVPRPSIPQTNYVPARRKVICFSDFDGTIFMQDTGHVLFDRHGCGISRREILEKQINTGERSFKEVSEEMWGSVRIPFEASFELMKSNLEIDPDFRSFHEYCMDHNIPFNVISAGLKPILRNVLDQFLGEEESSHIDIIANDADINPTGTTWRPIWRHTPSPLGHDKALTLSEYRTTISQTCVPGTTPLIIFIGDGVSDLPAAKQADLLFARRGLKLEWYCVQNKIAYFPFDTFGDILREVEGLMVSLEDQQVPRKEVEGRTVGLAEVRGGDFLEPSLNDTIPFPLPKLEESLLTRPFHLGGNEPLDRTVVVGN